jgi:hypothetical protein
MRRTRSVGTKVTDDEYAKLEHLAAGQTLSEWIRDVLLATATPRPADQVILAEFLAVRTIILNLHFALANDETPTADAMKRLIERADGDKLRKAKERLVAASVRRDS